MDQPSLGAYLESERQEVEAALRRALDEMPFLPDWLAGAVRQGVLSAGKRLRPVLCMAAYRALGGRRPEIVDLACALELIHAYSLMHDDLPCMDDAPLRRGLPTPHMVHGESAALIGGAMLIPGAALHAWEVSSRMDLPDPVRRELVRTLCRAAGGGGMVGGQALDLLGEGQALGREALDALHRRKTGALLSGALRMGGLAAEGTEAELQAIERYGAAIGLAFQIADDVLDATADAAALGKEPSDALLDKSTYVSLLGVEAARGEAGALVDEALTALREGGIQAPALEALARYIVERDR